MSRNKSKRNVQLQTVFTPNSLQREASISVNGQLNKFRIVQDWTTGNGYPNASVISVGMAVLGLVPNTSDEHRENEVKYSSNTDVYGSSNSSSNDN